MLEIGKTYKDGWGKSFLVVGVSATNPDYWVVTDPSGMYRATDGRKCIYDPRRGLWRCPDGESRWDLNVNSGT